MDEQTLEACPFCGDAVEYRLDLPVPAVFHFLKAGCPLSGREFKPQRWNRRARKVAELTWRPIESAPKDEWMLVFIPAEDSDMGQIHAARNMKIANGHTMIVGHHFVSDLAGKPSHWMPLPTPPALAPYPERR